MLIRIIDNTDYQRLNKWISTAHTFFFKWITENCYISDSVSVITFISYRELESCKLKNYLKLSQFI